MKMLRVLTQVFDDNAETLFVSDAFWWMAYAKGHEFRHPRVCIDQAPHVAILHAKDIPCAPPGAHYLLSIDAARRLIDTPQSIRACV
jgi:hypothetical protein